MTTYEFEVAAKNAVIDFARDRLDLDLMIEDVDVVWMTHVLGFKKCLLFSKRIPFYCEVTYNLKQDVIYLDVYEKQYHKNIYDYKTVATCDFEEIEDDFK